MQSIQPDRSELASEILELARQAGSTAAEVLIREGIEFSTVVRMRSVEKLQEAKSRKLGIRLFHGRRAAVGAASDFSLKTLRQMVRDTLEMARQAGEDEAAGLPEPGTDCATGTTPRQHGAPGVWLQAEKKIELARRCENAALDFDPRIVNSEGAVFSDFLIRRTYGSTAGPLCQFSSSACSLSVTPLAEAAGKKQRDYWLTTHPEITRLQAPELVGREAARRALRRLGARKVQTCDVPVVFEPLAAGRLLQHMADALSGTAILRKASFLMGKKGMKIGSHLLTVWDDPLLPDGLASRPFDSEGVPSQKIAVVRDGVLENFLLDVYSARKLGMKTTGHSNREPDGSPSVGPSNFFLQPGNASPADIIGSIKQGLCVSELIGFGVNLVSGDYSQGAAGFWIEDGELAFPVEEITIAGNLGDMLTRIEAVGNDLEILGEVFSPTLLIGKMVVSGD